jgi:hypothetical protein
MEEVLAPSQTLLEKLQFKDEKNVLIQGLPSTVEKQFVKISFAKSVTPLLKVRKIDFALVFAISHKQLKDILHDVVPALHDETKLWVAYPKAASKIVSDLTRDCNWECIAYFGYEEVEFITMDSIWTAMRFKKSNTGVNKLVVTENKVKETKVKSITTPPALELLFIKNKAAKSFYENLPFSDKNEYITWIAGAKKETTKLARLEATIEKLNYLKRSPSEK